MKPSLLKITGLNSFSQTETIDFDKLTEKGLFGIFGPTGSGKSTVLDAITLALYGDVARKTKSYINSDCDKTNIYFEFFSGHGSERKKYIIDRTIKRTKKGIQTANITLEIYLKDSELREGIIEKRSAVEKELIENIVKLNFEDFIRTVVLPQGKFSEFLTLTGAERNNMLERILGLEEYGQSLTEKINFKKTQTNSELDKLEGERSRYSESSTEKVKELENIKRDILKEETSLKKDIEQLQQEYKKYSTIFELVKELKEYKDIEQNLLDVKENMKLKEKKFIKARNALHISPSLDQLDQSTKEKKENNELMKKLEIEINHSKEKLKHIEGEYKKAYDIKERDYEKLIEKKSKVDSVIGLEKENLELKQLMETNIKELNSLKENIENKSIKLKEIEKQKSDLETHAIEIEKEIKNKSISSLYKKTLIEGMDIEQKYRETEKLLKEKSEDMLIYENRIKSGNEKIKQLKITQQSNTDELKEQKNSYIKLSKILESKELYGEKLKAEIEKDKEKSLASRIALHLENDCPCPVCGSVEHPNIASQIDQTEIKAKENLKTELENDITLLHKEIALIDSLFKTNKINIKLNSYDTDKDVNLSHNTEFREISLSVKDKLERLSDKRIELEKNEIQYTGLLETLEESLQKSKKEHNTITESLSDLKQKYKKALVFLEVKDIKTKYEQVSVLEEQVEKLNKQEKILREKLKQIDIDKDQLEKEIQKGQITAQKLKTSVDNTTLQIEKNQMDISKVTEGEDASILKLNLEHNLKKIINDEKQLRDIKDSLKDENIKLTENKLTTVSLDLKLTNDIEKITQKLSTLIKEYEFKSIDEVRSFTLKREEIDSLENMVYKYKREKENVKSNITRVEKSLNGEFITFSELNELNLNKTEKEKRQDEVIEEKGKIIQKLEEMNKNIETVREIDKNIKVLEIRKDSLDEIGKMTKGKRFVEFVSRNHLKYVARVATEKLKDITRGRFGIVLNNESVFEIVDNFSGGITRDSSSLSGGETFLTSLALALALSTKIQLKGNTSMEFFFLDEGFGTLDVETLDTAMTALEKLYNDNLSVGIISHVEEIKNRVPIKLMVSPPVSGVSGSKVKIQMT